MKVCSLEAARASLLPSIKAAVPRATGWNFIASLGGEQNLLFFNDAGSANKPGTRSPFDTIRTHAFTSDPL
jgi:hypothetical protein